MKLIRTMLVGALGTAALMPTLPAWAEAGAANGPVGSKPSDPAPAVQAGAPAASGPATAPAAAPAAGAPTAAPAQAKPVAGSVTADGRARDPMRQRQDDRRAFFEARLAALHAGLQLTPAQRQLWPPLEAAIRELVRARQGARRRQDEEMSGTERLRLRSARMIAVGQALGRLADSAGPMLDALGPEQKERLPVLLRGVGPRRAIAEAFGLDETIGERPWRHRFADEGNDGRFDLYRDGRDGGGRRGDWDREDRAGRFGPADEGFGGDDGMRFPHHRRRGWDEGEDRMGD